MNDINQQLATLSPAKRQLLELRLQQLRQSKAVQGSDSVSNAQEALPTATVCIHRLFEEQAARTPDAVAVECEGQPLTYRELDARANQLAHYLQALGVGPESLIGLCLDRSLDMLVGLLGILKAGGAYVPLDPHYPPERLAFMVRDAQLSVLVSQQRHRAQLPVAEGQVVCLDSDWNLIAESPETLCETVVQPANLAYVIYTSGSTGTPKGVMIEHRALVSFVQSVIDQYELTDRDRILQFASISFDAAVEEIFPCLCRGGTLVLRNDEMLSSAATFLQRCQKWQVTVLDLPTAYWHYLVSQIVADEVRLPPELRLVIIGGEQASLETVKLWQQEVGDYPQLVNTYGPTEATVVATQFRWPGTESATQRSLPIGQALPHVQTYVLDKHLQRLPVGIPGELYLGGAGLARGYLNQPELNQSQFIANPFATSDGSDARLYKTGDRVRFRADGQLEFLGRFDDQVKLRGFRIELGEIETALSQHLAIQQCVVTVREDKPGDKRLVAYVVPAESEVPDTGELRHYLYHRLPDYMVPSAFVTLVSLPLTPSGKINRKALPKPESADIATSAAYVAPRTPMEQELAKIWAQVLNLEQVGIHDNFFELGGHSLLAVQLITKMQQSFQVALPLATLFQQPTIEHLAQLLQNSSEHSNESVLVPLRTEGKQAPLFCIHPVGGSVLCYAALTPHLNPERPLYGFQSPGLTGLEPPLTQIEEMAERYIEALRAMQPNGPYHLAGWSLGGVIAFEMAQQLHQQGDSVAPLVLIDSYPPSAFEIPEEFDYAKLLVAMVKDLSGLTDQELPVSLEELQELTPQAQLTYVMERAQQQQLLPTNVTMEYFENLWEIFLANLIAAAQYQPQPYDGSAILLRASQSDAIESQLKGKDDNGWEGLVSGELKVCTLQGDHYSLMRTPQVEIIARYVEQEIKILQHVGGGFTEVV
jgi:amino acid adenylation domain-containing protein